MSKHRWRGELLLRWLVGLLCLLGIFTLGRWQGRRYLEAKTDRGTCRSFVEYGLLFCIPRFPLHLSPPLGEPLDEAQREDVLTAGMAYNDTLYENLERQPYAVLPPLSAPWARAVDRENVACAAAEYSLKLIVALGDGALRPGGFHGMEQCWEGRLAPCAGELEGWTGWLRLREPFTPSRFPESLVAALPDVEERLAEFTEFRAPTPPSLEVHGGTLAEATPPKASPQPEAAQAACPPQRSCEAELQQLTAALETNLHQSRALEHLTQPPAVRVEAKGRELSQPAGFEGESYWRYTVPDKPFTWQKLPPCNPNRAEEAINGGCWMTTARVAPCGELFEHAGKCFVPVERKRLVPPQSEDRDGEAR